MPEKPILKRGSTVTSLFTLIILIAAGLFAIYFILQKTGLVPKIGQGETKEENATGSFMGMEILRIINFKDSKGVARKFIIIKSGEEGGIPKASAYITNKDLSGESAIKISTLSDDSTLGYTAGRVPIGGAGLTISVSQDKGPKYVVLTQTVAGASTITIIEETGEVISDDVVNKVYNIAGDKCRCGITFDSWDGKNKFQVRVKTEKGEAYIATVDVTSGIVLEDLKKV
ncbi:hypothetical protein HY382_03140 [Candidatus Curtissbacteria bacterium]|nr:hypothetical protein [Candidatus Curtissbacteria bacterium]